MRRTTSQGYWTLHSPRRQSRSVTRLPRGLSSWCRRWRVATTSTAPPSGTSSSTPSRGGRCWKRRRGGRKRRRRTRRSRTRRSCGRTSTLFTPLPGSRRGRRTSGGRKNGRRRSFRRPLPSLVVDFDSGMFLARSLVLALFAVVVRPQNLCIMAVWTRRTVTRLGGDAPRAVLHCLIVRPKMLRIVAGLDQKDSCLEEYRNIGFYWEMTSLRVRIQRSAKNEHDMRESTEWRNSTFFFVDLRIRRSSHASRGCDAPGHVLLPLVSGRHLFGVRLWRNGLRIFLGGASGIASVVILGSTMASVCEARWKNFSRSSREVGLGSIPRGGWDDLRRAFLPHFAAVFALRRAGRECSFFQPSMANGCSEASFREQGCN